MLGIDDPWIWGGYLIAFAVSIFTVAYGWISTRGEEEEEDD